MTLERKETIWATGGRPGSAAVAVPEGVVTVRPTPAPGSGTSSTVTIAGPIAKDVSHDFHQSSPEAKADPGRTTSTNPVKPKTASRQSVGATSRAGPRTTTASAGAKLSCASSAGSGSGSPVPTPPPAYFRYA